MTISMAKSQRIFEEDCEVDRILSLPGNVLDRIMEFMPVRDAARTCVLSSQWRYVWAYHPSLVLDKRFWDDVQRNRLPNETYMDFASVVSSILLYHVGQIMKFVIDVSVVSSVPHSSIDLWLSSLCRRGLHELDLRSSKTRIRYELPSWVFSTSELTRVSISKCIVKTKDNVGCFSKIKCLVLKHVTLDSWVLTTPLLTSLTLITCRGIRGFNIDAPRLAMVSLGMNDYLNLKPYLTCTGITTACFVSSEKFEHSDSVNLVKLASAWPSISVLAMEGFCLKYLSTGNITGIFQLNLRYVVLWGINLDSEVIASILCVLKNSPLLHTFEIWFAAAPVLLEVNYIVEPGIMEYKFEQLRTVKMKSFTASSVQVAFAEILLHCAPLLAKILVHQNNVHVPDLQMKIFKKLLVLQRTFPAAEIIFSPNIGLHSFNDSFNYFQTEYFKEF